MNKNKTHTHTLDHKKNLQGQIEQNIYILYQAEIIVIRNHFFYGRKKMYSLYAN